MSGASSDGYRIQSSGMDGEAGKLDRAGDDVGAIRKAVEDHMCYTPDALGGSDSGPAYNDFAAAWQAEAKTLEAALHELADKVGISQRKYENADHETILALHSAGANDGLTTMPAAAHPGTTTGLAPGARPAALGEPPIGTQPTPGGPPPSLSDFD
ncbi:WXG100 family type VII secretion target [Streptomyces sp. NPDC001492]